MRRRGAAAVAGVAFLALALAACSSDSSSASSIATAAASASESASTPTPEPTPAAVVWAEQYCKDRAGLDAAIDSLGSNLKIDIGPDIVQQIDRQLRLQALSVGNALQHTVTTLAVVPSDLPGVQADVQSMLATGTGAQADLEALGAQVQKVTGADNFLQAGAEAATAIGMAKAAYDKSRSFADAFGRLKDNDDPALREAMSQAPACAGR